MAHKERLDVLLVEKGLFSSRSRAKRAIMAGEIYVDGHPVDKAGKQISRKSKIEFRGSRLPYVSRGGLKLEKALKVFAVDPRGKKAIDIGASTGGFTDCLLQHGAEYVYAIDVGYGQLAWKLRQDSRVEVIERTNFRHLTPQDLPVEVSLIVTDVSFISLRLIIPPALAFLREEGDFIALIKPQFEAGPERVGNKGIVKDMSTHRDVIASIIKFSREKGLMLKGLDYSPITGASSRNIEFLVHMRYQGIDTVTDGTTEKLIKKVVKNAHKELIENE